MNILIPFPDFQPQAWVDMMQEGGFTPANAMKMYDEIRLFGHSMCRVNEGSVATQKWDEVRLRHCDVLKDIKTPEDFQQYLYDGSYLFSGCPKRKSGSEKTIQEDMKIKQEFANMWFQHGDLNRLDGAEIINRLSGRFEYNPPPHWVMWDQMDLSWTDLENMIGLDHFTQPASQRAYSAEDLQKATKDSGLDHVEWGVADNNSQFLSDLTHNIHQANIALQQRTQWSGPVLGVDGRVGLSLRALGQCRGACTSFKETDQTRIHLGPTDGWGVLSHEWLHALDIAMGFDPQNPNPEHPQSVYASQSASHLPHEAQAWANLVEQLTQRRRVVSEIHLEELATLRSQTTWANPTTPKEVGIVLSRMMAEHPDPIDGELRKKHLKEIAQAYKTLDPNNLLWAEIALTELDILRERKQVIKNNGSVWIQFAHRFEANVQRDRLDEDMKDYFQRTHEQVAHSFEATFLNGKPFITDIDVTNPSTSLRYPLLSEAKEHAEAWHTLFQTIQPWWTQQLGVPSFEERVNKKRKNEPQARAASEMSLVR